MRRGSEEGALVTGHAPPHNVESVYEEKDASISYVLFGMAQIVISAM